jgi:hypothetical protein
LFVTELCAMQEVVGGCAHRHTNEVQGRSSPLVGLPNQRKTDGGFPNRLPSGKLASKELLFLHIALDGCGLQGRSMRSRVVLAGRAALQGLALTVA